MCDVGFAALSDRQREVVGFANRGYSNKEIAFHLGISAATVSTHIRRARTALGVPSTCALMTVTCTSPAATGLDRLTRVEQEVVLHALRGLSNAAIAALRGTSPNTVANQIAAAFRKLGVASRRELTARYAPR